MSTIAQMRLQAHGVAARCHVSHAFIENGLEEHCSGGGSIAHLVLQAPEQVSKEHGPDVCTPASDLDDSFYDVSTVIEQAWRTFTEFGRERDEARGWPEGRGYSICDLVDPTLNTQIGARLKNDSASSSIGHIS